MSEDPVQKACEDCRFYRQPRKILAALNRALPRPLDHSSTLLQITNKQAEQRSDEFANWIEHYYDEPEDARWEPRPAVSPYCGRWEADAKDPRFHMAEVRNANGNCKDWDADSTTRSCATCRHATPADGRVEDERELEVRMHLFSLGATQAIDELLDRVVANQAQEVEAAYMSGGHLGASPRYLDHCQHQAPGESSRVACAVKNPDDRCPFWVAKRTSPKDPPTKGATS